MHQEVQSRKLNSTSCVEEPKFNALGNNVNCA